MPENTENIETSTVDEISELRGLIDSLTQERDALNVKLSEFEGGVEARAQDVELETMRKSNDDLKERLVALEIERRDARKDAVMLAAKTRGLPETMKPEVELHFNQGGSEAVEEYLDRLDKSGLLVPLTKRTGMSDIPESEGASSDIRAEAWRKIDEIRKDATEGGGSLTTRQALKQLRKIDGGEQFVTALGLQN